MRRLFDSAFASRKLHTGVSGNTITSATRARTHLSSSPSDEPQTRADAFDGFAITVKKRGEAKGRVTP